MNIRFSEDSIRVRVSLEEALSLQKEGLLAAKLPSIESGISLELIIQDQRTELLDFSLKSSAAQLLVSRQQLHQLIEAAPSRDSCLETQIETKDRTSAKLILEIDLFSRRKNTGTKRMKDSPLSQAELLRYQRQMILPEIGLAGQIKLKEAKVLVVGAGGLGCPVLTYLAAAGVGTIKVADADLVDGSNLHRQPLYSEASIGRSKVEEVARVLMAANPWINVIPIADRVGTGNIRDLLSDADIIVDCTDNFASKYLLNDACVEMNKVLVSGSIFCFEGQISVFNAIVDSTQRGPTYRCLFPEPPGAALVPSCAEAGVLGVLPGIVGSLQAAEVIKIILGLGELLSGRLLIIDTLSMQFREVRFNRNKEIAENTNIRTTGYYTALAEKCASNQKSIKGTELKSKLKNKEKIVLIDVREASEKEEFDIGGELIPSGSILANAERIPREGTVVLYCRSGVRSQRCISDLTNKFGFTNLLNLEGGILAWLDEADGNN